MTTKTLTLADFLLARIAEDEAVARSADEARLWRVSQANDRIIADAGHMQQFMPSRMLAECEAKRRIIEWHQNWPVLVEQPPRIGQGDAECFDFARGDLSSLTIRMSQRIAWMTEREYRSRFGSEPPTGPVLRYLAGAYADHPDYRDEWRP